MVDMPNQSSVSVTTEAHTNAAPVADTGPRKRLVVFVPDRTGKMTALEPLIAFLKQQPELAHAIVLPLPFEVGLLSNRPLQHIASDLNTRIENVYLKHRHEISSLTLCGYSLGVLLARRAYLDACGLGPAGAVSSWAAHVERFVFIAAICRGFDSRRFRWWERLAMAALGIVGLGKTIRQAYEGEPFVNNVRLDWAHHRGQTGPRPMLVNFLGRGDRLVRKEDAIDLLQDPDARPVDVIGDHDTIVDVTGNDELYRLGFIGNPNRGIPPGLTNYPRADRVYILLHGMRSSKRFMKALQLAIRAEEGAAADVRLPDFGYIPLGPFLSAARRRRLAARFVDDYTQCLAVNPHKEFRFAGHSNGTAILGHALLENPRLAFKRVYLGGSVLPTTFDWGLVKGRGQVEFVRSDMGSTDWAVGILARALERWSSVVPSFRGLGSGGHDGFSNTDVSPIWMNEVPIAGQHSEMFADVKGIAKFMTSRERVVESEEPIQSPWWFRAAQKEADWLVPLIALTLVIVAVASLVSGVWPVPFVAAVGGPGVGMGIIAVLLFVLFRY